MLGTFKIEYSTINKGQDSRKHVVNSYQTTFVVHRKHVIYSY